MSAEGDLTKKNPKKHANAFYKATKHIEHTFLIYDY